MKLRDLNRVTPKVLLALGAVPCLALATIVTGIDLEIGGVARSCAPSTGACRPETVSVAQHFLQHAAILVLPVLGPLAGYAAWQAFAERRRRRLERRRLRRIVQGWRHP